MNEDRYKRRSAERALDFVVSGMALGLGSGSTAAFMVDGLAARLRDGRLHNIVGVPTSEATAALAEKLGVPLATLDERPELDLALDGADEIDPRLNAIKGLGGALLREKIVASAARRFVLFGDSSKRVRQLGERAPVPVEVVPFGLAPSTRKLAALGCEPILRRAAGGEPFRTDGGSYILDCRFGLIADPEALAAAIAAIPGVVEHGLFLGMAQRAVLAGPAGVEILEVQPTL